MKSIKKVAAKKAVKKNDPVVTATAKKLAEKLAKSIAKTNAERAESKTALDELKSKQSESKPDSKPLAALKKAVSKGTPIVEVPAPHVTATVAVRDGKTGATRIVPATKEATQPAAPNAQETVRCKHCGDTGHVLENCRLKKEGDRELLMEATRRCADIGYVPPPNADGDVHPTWIKAREVMKLDPESSVIIDVKDPGKSDRSAYLGFVKKAEPEKGRIHLWIYNVREVGTNIQDPRVVERSFMTFVARGTEMHTPSGAVAYFRQTNAFEHLTMVKQRKVGDEQATMAETVKTATAESKPLSQRITPPTPAPQFYPGCPVTILTKSEPPAPARIMAISADGTKFKVHYAYEDGIPEKVTIRKVADAKPPFTFFDENFGIACEMTVSNDVDTKTYFSLIKSEKPGRLDSAPAKKEDSKSALPPKSKTPFDNLTKESAKFRNDPEATVKPVGPHAVKKAAAKTAIKK